DRGNVIVKLDRSEGFLPAREQIPRSYHRQGDYVRAVVINVDRSAKGPQVILSRTHPDFLRRLFESEVPEIAENIVEIKAVAREAGFRSKISVYSNDPRVDAVGSCVGLKGSRVQSIVRELGGERIDIVPWSTDAGVFVSRALWPAKVMDGKGDEAHQRRHRDGAGAARGAARDAGRDSRHRREDGREDSGVGQGVRGFAPSRGSGPGGRRARVHAGDGGRGAGGRDGGRRGGNCRVE